MWGITTEKMLGKQEGSGWSDTHVNGGDWDAESAEGRKEKKKRTRGMHHHLGDKGQGREACACWLWSTDRYFKGSKAWSLRVLECETLRLLPGVIAAGLAGCFWLNPLKFGDISWWIYGACQVLTTLGMCMWPCDLMHYIFPLPPPPPLLWPPCLSPPIIFAHTLPFTCFMYKNVNFF